MFDWVTSQERVDASTLLGGLELFPLPEGEVPVEAMVVVKLLDRSGRPAWSFRRTCTSSDEELLGVLGLVVVGVPADHQLVAQELDLDHECPPQLG